MSPFYKRKREIHNTMSILILRSLTLINHTFCKTWKLVSHIDDERSKWCKVNQGKERTQREQRVTGSGCRQEANVCESGYDKSRLRCLLLLSHDWLLL